MGICVVYNYRTPNHQSVLPLVRRVRRSLGQMTVYLPDGVSSNLYHLSDGFLHTSRNYPLRLLSCPLALKQRHPPHLYPYRYESAFSMVPKEDGAVQVVCMIHHAHDHDCVNGHLREQNRYPHSVLVVDLVPGVHRVSDAPDHSIANVHRIVFAPQQSRNQNRAYQTETIDHTRLDQWAREDTFAPPAVDKKSGPDNPSLPLASNAEEASYGRVRNLRNHVALRDRNHARVDATSYAPSRGHAHVQNPRD